MHKITALLMLLALVASPAAMAQTTHSAAATPAADKALDGFMHPRPDLVTAGQPEAGAWPTLRAHGVSTVINLRTDAEMRGRDEAAAVAAAGMHYERLPIAGAADINTAHADELWQRIEDAPGRVLVHCASGNRVGALLAIGAARHAGMSPAEALAFGRKAGLTGLEPRVREVLGLSPDTFDK